MLTHPARAQIVDILVRVPEAERLPLLRSLIADLEPTQRPANMIELVATMRQLSPRAAKVLYQQTWTLKRFFEDAHTGHIRDVHGASWHVWAIWVITAEHYGRTPNWYRDWDTTSRATLDAQISHERVRLSQPDRRSLREVFGKYGDSRRQALTVVRAALEAELHRAPSTTVSRNRTPDNSATDTGVLALAHQLVETLCQAAQAATDTATTAHPTP